MTNFSALQQAAALINEGGNTLNKGRAALMMALVPALDMRLSASVGGKAVPFTISDYAFKPVTDKGKANGKLRNAQFSAIMSQGLGESEVTADVSATVKTAFNDTFPAALYIRYTMLNVSLNDEGKLNGVPLAYAFDCYGKDGKLTSDGKALVERIIAMFSPDTGPELTETEAEASLATRFVDGVGGTMNRRYGLKTLPLGKVIASIGKAAVNAGLVEKGASRAPRNPEAEPTPLAIIAGFNAFVAKVIGGEDEAEIALDNEGVKALKALQSKIAAAIKALA
jgi:hypothetical protein